MNTQLENYYNRLLAAQQAEKERTGTQYTKRVENPDGTCNTLWIPEYSGNRTATMNLNHKLIGFVDGVLLGVNGNCGTIYEIVPLPESWTQKNQEEKLDALSRRVCEKLRKPSNYPQRRVLKMSRMNIILETLQEMG